MHGTARGGEGSRIFMTSFGGRSTVARRIGRVAPRGGGTSDLSF